MNSKSRIDHISLALSGYEAEVVSLESFVDYHGYQHVMEKLIVLSKSSSLPILENPSSQFLKSLSPKSKGLMLTSALVAGKEALYAPLYSYAASSVADMYPQDLPSLLGGNQAPSALSEMTRRATKSIGALQDFSFGLTQISQASPSSGLLSGVRADISSSSWVEAFPEDSRGLMTLVSAAPAKLEIEPLKTNALSRYLKAGLKLASVAGVIAGIGLVGLYGASFAHTAGEIGFVDLKNRPTIETKLAHGKVEQRKIVKYGEIATLEMMGLYGEVVTSQTIKQAA